MTRYKWEDIRGDNIPFVGQIAKGARTFACNLWNKYPDKFAYGQDPVSSPAKFYWNTVCAADNINRQPSPKIPGGQCPGVSYRVSLFVTYKSGTTENYTTGIFPGPITEVYIASTPSSGDGVWLRYGTQNPQQTALVRSNVSSNPVTKVKVLSVIRTDELPDNCGEKPAEWKPILPAPNPGAENWNITINDSDGNIINIPLVWNDIDFNADLHFDFEVGEINFDLGGITVNFNNNNNWNMNDPGDGSGLSDSDRETITNTNVVVNNTNNVVQDFKDKYDEDRKPIDEEDFTPDEKPPTDSEEEEDPEIEFLIVNVVNPPNKGKAITNQNPEDTFYWAGYFCWTVNGARTTHVVVQKTSNVYKKPTWATGYALFSVNGATLQVTTYKKKVTSPT